MTIEEAAKVIDEDFKKFVNGIKTITNKEKKLFEKREQEIFNSYDND